MSTIAAQNSSGQNVRCFCISFSSSSEVSDSLSGTMSRMRRCWVTGGSTICVDRGGSLIVGLWDREGTGVGVAAVGRGRDDVEGREDSIALSSLASGRSSGHPPSYSFLSLRPTGLKSSDMKECS
jgi:hypothetical protein